jgi:acetoin:2,6-dichlorophenolindophenol oxidoreductase subunit alpha
VRAGELIASLAPNPSENRKTTMSDVDIAENQLFALYERMLLIRRTEERLRDEAKAGNLPGAVHLYIGEEAIATGVCAHLSERDMITSTHRGHGHFLAKGGQLNAMMAEIWAKDTGICRGMGGSMHVADFSKGILGANGIVGAGFAIATGAAYSAMLAREGRVVVDFFGDGASNQGTLMECLNVASLWQLPLVFVCEHNSFSEFSPAHTVTSGQIVDRARAFKLPVTVIDGNDVTAVWHAARVAIERARSGGGPSFIEAHTYRIQGHLEAEELFLSGQRYREATEIEAWRERCPVARLRTQLAGTGAKTAAQLTEIEARVAAQVNAAVRFAEESPPADPELAFSLMFDGQQP